ncbi:O-antigen ligase [uncultured Clostridium sp.]|uniref:O-antigen ligase family protein n=1 Tax=uncultured Clostridium sp. TaxID=59620 RepID=UPI00189AC8D1|nr:O-antigen ligase family protein [uncultured Clostridium sp.]
MTISRDNRIASLLENSNNLGIFSLMCLFISLMLLIDSKKIFLKIFYGLIFACSSFNIIVCQSRNAILGIIIGIAIITVIYNKKLLYLYILSPLLLLIPQIRILALTLLSLTPDSSRYKIWKTTALMIKDHPLFGIGYENYSVLYLDYVNKSKETLTTMEGYGWVAQHPHNMFLKFQVETGILGSISLLIFLTITSIVLFKYINNKNNKINKLILSIFIVFITFNLLSIFDCYYSAQKLSTAIFIILGFGMSLINIYNKNSFSYSN